MPASVPERVGAEEIFWRLKGQEVASLLEKIWADGGFEGKDWQARMQQQFGFEVEIVKRSDDVKGFQLLPKRWVVERSFGWMNRYRRLSKDHEGNCLTARAWMLWAMIHKMLNYMNPKTKLHPFKYNTI